MDVEVSAVPAVVPGVSNFIQTRANHSAKSGEGGPRSAKKEYNHEGRSNHRSAIAAAIFATVPISPQVTSRGVAVNIDTAQAITYGHARRVNRRVDRRDFRQTRRAVRRGATID
jgi:hypothetical protein